MRRTLGPLLYNLTARIVGSPLCTNRRLCVEPWHIWAILAIALFVLEIFTPGFVLATIAVGCLASALASAAGLSLPLQVLAFSVGTLTAFLGIRPLVLRKLHSGDQAFRSNVDALLGKTARVLEAVDPGSDTGRVNVAGENWRAVSATGEPIAMGSAVTVVEVDGTKVVVVPEDAFREE